MENTKFIVCIYCKKLLEATCISKNNRLSKEVNDATARKVETAPLTFKKFLQ